MANKSRTQGGLRVYGNSRIVDKLMASSSANCLAVVVLVSILRNVFGSGFLVRKQERL